MITDYWLLVICNGEPILWGPYPSDTARIDEYDMALIDPGTEYCIFIDPDNAFEPGKPWAYKPSHQYRAERLDYIKSLEDQEL